MIKEALQYVVGLNRPEVLEIKDQMYSDKSLMRISHNPKAKILGMSTLTSLVDYITAEIDSMADKMIVQVISPLEVKLISMLDGERIREELVCVKGNVPDFEYGKYVPHENFIVALQAKFIADGDRELVLKYAGTAESGTVANYSDDGVSQKASIKKGVASSEIALVPNPVMLRPFRTFKEVEQPESSFVFRMRDSDHFGVECALFEADGGAWKDEAMRNIKAYLKDMLESFNAFDAAESVHYRFTVIS